MKLYSTQIIKPKNNPQISCGIEGMIDWYSRAQSVPGPQYSTTFTSSDCWPTADWPIFWPYHQWAEIEIHPTRLRFHSLQLSGVGLCPLQPPLSVPGWRKGRSVRPSAAVAHLNPSPHPSMCCYIMRSFSAHHSYTGWLYRVSGQPLCQLEPLAVSSLFYRTG